MKIFLVILFSFSGILKAQKINQQEYLITKAKDTLFGNVETVYSFNTRYYKKVKLKIDKESHIYGADEIMGYLTITNYLLSKKADSLYYESVLIKGEDKQVILPRLIDGDLKYYFISTGGTTPASSALNLPSGYRSHRYIGNISGNVIEIKPKNFKYIITTYFVTNESFRGLLKRKKYIFENKKYNSKNLEDLIVKYNSIINQKFHAVK